MGLVYLITINSLGNTQNKDVLVDSTYVGDFVTYESVDILNCLSYGGNTLFEVTFDKKTCKQWGDTQKRIILDKITVKGKYELSDVKTFEFLNQIGALRKPNDETLYWACKKGYLDIVNYLLNNNYGIHNAAPLEYSIYGNNFELFIYLINKTKESDINKDNMLVLSAYTGNLEIIKYLMYIGADMATHDNLPIYLLALYGHVDALEFALNFNVDIHTKNDYIRKFAENYGHHKIITLLDNYKKHN